MDGGEVPSSFLEGLMLPISKNGNSDDAQDYIPITLLHTCYKILARILAKSMQDELPSISSSTQHGFIRARLLEQAIILMQATLLNAQDTPTQSIDDSAVVILLV